MPEDDITLAVLIVVHKHKIGLETCEAFVHSPLQPSCNAYSSRKFWVEAEAASHATLDRTPKRKVGLKWKAGSSSASSTSVSASVSMLVSRDTSGLEDSECSTGLPSYNETDYSDTQ